MMLWFVLRFSIVLIGLGPGMTQSFVQDSLSPITYSNVVFGIRELQIHCLIQKNSFKNNGAKRIS